MRSRAIAVLVAAVVSLAVSGCSSDDDPDTSSSRPPTETSETTTEPTEAPSPSESETGVAPAEGPAVELENSMRFHLPEDGDEWHHRGDGSMVLVGGHPVDDGSFDFAASEIDTLNSDLDSLVEASLASRAHQAELTPGRFDPVPTRSPNREVNGREGWVIESVGKESTFYEFGTVNAGVTVIITFQYPTSHALGEEWVESMLASIEWK